MASGATVLEALGGEAGCQRLSAAFYARVAKDPVLRPLFPGKSLRCAIEAFAAFLIQFLDGDENQTQHRWWLSLRESHARFRIGPAERRAWLKHMHATLDAAPTGEQTRAVLRQFFEHSSAYVMGTNLPAPEDGELGARWRRQLVLDDAIAAIAAAGDQQAISLVPQFASRPSVFVGLLARMVQSRRQAMIGFVVDAIQRDASLVTRRYAGRTLLHFAAAAGCPAVVNTLLRLGAGPGMLDAGGHTPLYRVANECASPSGPEVVRILVRAGADVNACGNVMRTTPLHMAARRGFLETARALLECGAAIDARDRRGETPLQRALNCRRAAVAQLLEERGAAQATRNK